jgi:hypothetical protein
MRIVRNRIVAGVIFIALACGLAVTHGSGPVSACDAPTYPGHNGLAICPQP